MNKIEKLSECVSDKREEWVKEIPLNAPEYLFDDELINDLESIGTENDDDWFKDRRIGRWSSFRNSLTKKDLSEMIE